MRPEYTETLHSMELIRLAAKTPDLYAPGGTGFRTGGPKCIVRIAQKNQRVPYGKEPCSLLQAQRGRRFGKLNDLEQK